METDYIVSSEFWESAACDVMVNDRDTVAVEQAQIIESWCLDKDELHGCLLFSTSGSTGGRKWVVLSRQAVLESAKAVNQRFHVTAKDHWLLALPLFHVGGMGVAARAYLASCQLSVSVDRWDAEVFHSLLGKKGVTLTSLVPAQLSDLVNAELRAPDGLRGAFIGGGSLLEDVYQKAIELGWPVLETYGMTEAASQIATASSAGRRLKVLPCWDTRVDTNGILMIYGKPLFKGYLRVTGSHVEMETTSVDGWFHTNDLVEIDGGHLSFKGRADRCVKVLGELVDLVRVEEQLRSYLDEREVAVFAMSDDRKESRLLAVVEGAADLELLNVALDAYNKVCIPVARVDSISCVEKLPRSALGKILYAELGLL